MRESQMVQWKHTKRTRHNMRIARRFHCENRRQSTATVDLQFVRLSHKQIKVSIIVNWCTDAGIVIEKLLFGDTSIDRSADLEIS